MEKKQPSEKADWLNDWTNEENFQLEDYFPFPTTATQNSLHARALMHPTQNADNCLLDCIMFQTPLIRWMTAVLSISVVLVGQNSSW